jgi:DNA-binding transcriptional LysR family regulator
MIDKLEFVIALASEQHFGRAAETCNVSQPTLSAGIKQLEDMFGVLLVQRGSRFRGFTPDGERVLEWARRIVADTRAMRQEVDALKRGLAGHVQIAAIPTALAMTAMLTTPYRAKHPEVRFTIVSRTSIQVLGMLENLEVDAGLTYVDNEPLGRVNTIPLYHEEHRLLTSSSGELGNRDRVDHELRPRWRLRISFDLRGVRLLHVGVLKALAGLRLLQDCHRSDDARPAGDRRKFRKPPLAEHRPAVDRVALLRHRADDLVTECLH